MPHGVEGYGSLFLLAGIWVDDKPHGLVRGASEQHGRGLL
jgi:hypothetical protein